MNRRPLPESCWVPFGWVLIPCCLAWAGCSEPRTPPSVQTSSTDSPTSSEAESSTELPADAPVQEPVVASAPTSSTPSTDAAAADASELAPVSAEDARRGSTITGGGIITEPLRQYFLIQHRFVLLNVDHALQLFEAEHGRKPKSHEEFMAEIIEKNSLELPELDAGWDYYYDTSDGELKKRKVG
jgi:hypothetical protein